MSHYQKYGHLIRKWKIEHKDKIIIYQKNYREINKEKTKVFQTKLKEKLKKQILAILGDMCVCCGCIDWWNLTVDHKNPKTRQGDSKYALYNKIIRGKINNNELQILCFGCNTSKHLSSKCVIDHKINV